MRALITGASGFIGGSLARRLSRKGVQLQLLGRPESNLSAFDMSSEAFQISVWEGDPARLVNQLLSNPPPEVIFHCAANVTRNHSSHDIAPIVSANIVLLTSLLEFMSRSTRPPVLINVGASSQYAKSGQIAPDSFYTATKVAAEVLIDFYTKRRNCKAITLVLTTTYGEADTTSVLVNSVVHSIVTGEPLRMTKGEQIVDLIHIDDVVAGLMIAAERGLSLDSAVHETFFALGGNAMSVKDFVSLSEQIAGRKINVEWDAIPYRPQQIMQPYTHGPRLPGWKPKVTLEEGIGKLIVAESSKMHDGCKET